MIFKFIGTGFSYPVVSLLFQASNLLVRANAAMILVDAFPLQDPSAGLIQNDQLKQMQLDTIAVSSKASAPGPQVFLKFENCCNTFLVTARKERF